MTGTFLIVFAAFFVVIGFLARAFDPVSAWACAEGAFVCLSGFVALNWRRKTRL